VYGRPKLKFYQQICNGCNEPPKYIVALLLHCIGKDALCLYNGMDMSDDRKDPVKIIKRFDEHICGETKELFERYKFNMCDQSFEQYYSTFRNLEKTIGLCNCTKDKLIVDRLILGVSNNWMDKLMDQPKLDLTIAVAICRCAEATENNPRS